MHTLNHWDDVGKEWTHFSSPSLTREKKLQPNIHLDPKMNIPI